MTDTNIFIDDQIDDVDDVDAHAIWCHCDECDPDRQHDQREAA